MSLMVVASVSDDKLLNSLVLGHASGAVHAANRLHMAMAIFSMAVVSSFLCHLGSKAMKERSFLNTVKAIYEKPIADIILNVHNKLI